MVADLWQLQTGQEALTFTDDIYGIALAAAPQITTDEQTQDEHVSRADAVRFGEDFITAASVALPVTARGRDQAETEALRAEFLRFWRGDNVRKAPGRLVELVAPSGRRMFGRTRRPMVNSDSEKFGIARITAAFDAVSPDWFGPQQEVHSEPLGTISGGLTAPLTAPLTTVGDGTSRTLVEVGGSASTPLRLTFTGPAVNPQVTLGPIQVALATSLAWDEQIIIDARPWRHTVTRSWSTSARAESAAGVLTAWSTPMSRMRLDPGLYELVYHATTTSADAGVRVGFADAHHTY